MLAISTATKNALIGIEYNGKKFCSSVDADCKQSENILVEIDKLLDKNNIKLEELGDFAVVVGPGSFTGLRIGSALIKGLCAGQPQHLVLPISTLDFMAYVFEKQKKQVKFTCVINALSGRYFVADYDEYGKKLSSEMLISQEDLDKRETEKVFLFEEFSDKNNVELSAELLIEFALKHDKKCLINADKLEPIYIRKSQAEENLK